MTCLFLGQLLVQFLILPLLRLEVCFQLLDPLRHVLELVRLGLGNEAVGAALASLAQIRAFFNRHRLRLGRVDDLRHKLLGYWDFRKSHFALLERHVVLATVHQSRDNEWQLCARGLLYRLDLDHRLHSAVVLLREL